MPKSQSSTETNHSSQTKLLCVTGFLTLLIYAVITWLSFYCEQADAKDSRPLLQVIAFFTAAGLAYLFVCWRLIRPNHAEVSDESSSNLKLQGLKIIFGFGIAFRLILLFSVPIQEVDLFRYIWDGTVISQGINPYEYSPQEVQLYPTKGVPNFRTTVIEREDLAKLSAIATSPGMDEAFKWVHFEQYTTPYPMANQAPFALASIIGRSVGDFAYKQTDDPMSVYWSLLFSMKGVLIVFDLATAVLLVALLKKVWLPQEWVVAYLWCPLLLKEIANSGHLDSIVVFFTTAAVYLMVGAYWRVDVIGHTSEPPEDDANQSALAQNFSNNSSLLKSFGVAMMLALAVAAKLFPVVLGPIWAVLMLKRLKFLAILPLILFAVITAVLLWPMVGRTDFVSKIIDPVVVNADGTMPPPDSPPAGIEAFVKYWEMNDFIFMVAVENLKPYGESAQQYAAANESTESQVWFVKTTNEFRHRVADWYHELTGVPKQAAPFSMTRRITLVVFFLIVIWTCVRMFLQDDPRVLLEMVFLTIAWFWFLAPTQNPWYWTWALPWLVFCRNRIWFVVSVVAMAYYLRFYYEYHGVAGAGESGLLGTPYAGTAFFDFIFPVLEFAPILLALFLSRGWAWVGSLRKTTVA